MDKHIRMGFRQKIRNTFLGVCKEIGNCHLPWIPDATGDVRKLLCLGFSLSFHSRVGNHTDSSLAPEIVDWKFECIVGLMSRVAINRHWGKNLQAAYAKLTE